MPAPCVISRPASGALKEHCGAGSRIAEARRRAFQVDACPVMARFPPAPAETYRILHDLFIKFVEVVDDGHPAYECRRARTDRMLEPYHGCVHNPSYVKESRQGEMSWPERRPESKANARENKRRARKKR